MLDSDIMLEDLNVVKEYKGRFLEIFKIFKPEYNFEAFKTHLEDRLKQLEEYEEIHDVMLALSRFLVDFPEKAGIF